MKIGIISFFFGSMTKPFIAGTATHTFYLSENLCRSGHDVHVFTSSNKNFVKKRRIGKGTLTVHFIDCRVEDFKDELKNMYLKFTKFDRSIFHEVEKENKKRKFDVINTNGFLTNSALFIKIIFGIKWVHTIHVVDAERVEKGKFPESLMQAIKLWESSAKFADGFIGVSKYIMNAFKEYYKPKGKIVVIENGVDANIFRPKKVDRKKYGFSKNDKIILFIGRLSREKGIEILFDLMKKLLKKENLKFILITPFIPVQRMKSTVIRLKKLMKTFDGKIKHFYSVPHKTLSEIYNISDVCIQPSLYEAFSLTLLEAMSCGKIVVGPKVGGPREFIKNGWNGFLAKPTTSSFLKKINFVLEKDDDELEKIRERGISTARKFSYERVTEKTINFFKNLNKS